MSFEVVPDELRAHGSHLDGLVDRLHTAVDAAKTVTLDDEAYGLLCGFLPPIVNATTQDDATDTLNAAVEGVSTIADNVRTAATSYDDQDQTNAQPFQAQLREGTVVAP
ncbi:ESX-1 secretion-associated protein [Amycolatopsis sp. K13G38]|uniref:ESX-1 secretion-associated protein n=1 Tax=Amycolatopsis acididurans TaxID=2724524 RepID=A0ABX1IYR9_9PSEU|nr:type VII secretion target [Amycolatopsis acididurans]NKQ51275.1 ESX-1 secretion-associated protein [Amycolatopsis acididurans]